MNKKLLAILMALAMIISVVPMAALAAEDHEHTWSTSYVSQGGATHAIECVECGDIQPGSVAGCTGFGANCWLCGASLTPEEPKCNHEGGAWISNGDGTHTSSCDCGENTVNGECQNIGGKCYMCGYDMSHECSYDAGITSNDDGTHNINCSCGKFVTVNCMDNDGDGKCDSCGYLKYVHDCTFEAGVTSNEDGTHNVNCSCGNFVTVNCLDNDGDGKCDSCGYQKYTTECKHGFMAVKDNGDGKTHKVTCRDCGEVIAEQAEHEFSDYGVCACGAIASTGCDHDGVQEVIDNRDGETHKVICQKCGEVIAEKAEHTYSSTTGKCACGAEKSAAPAGSGSASDPNLDDVPKTGSNGIVITLFSILLIGSVGTVALVQTGKKKYI